MKLLSKKRGFTLVELIIVIVLLGILSAVAAPRFVDFSKDARITSLQKIKAELKYATDAIYAKAQIDKA